MSHAEAHCDRFYLCAGAEYRCADVKEERVRECPLSDKPTLPVQASVNLGKWW
jgi:hypothetical protein